MFPPAMQMLLIWGPQFWSKEFERRAASSSNFLEIHCRMQWWSGRVTSSSVLLNTKLITAYHHRVYRNAHMYLTEKLLSRGNGYMGLWYASIIVSLFQTLSSILCVTQQKLHSQLVFSHSKARVQGVVLIPCLHHDHLLGEKWDSTDHDIYSHAIWLLAPLPWVE
jgi:hypothetical protein